MGIPLSPAPSPVPSIRRLRVNDSSDGADGWSRDRSSSDSDGDVDPVHSVVRQFARLSDYAKISALRAILDGCPREVLVETQAHIVPKLRHDPFRILPIEISLRILSFIKDPKSLAAASQVSKLWYLLLSDDSTWKSLCEAHHFRRLSAAGSHVHWRVSMPTQGTVPENAIADSGSPSPGPGVVSGLNQGTTSASSGGSVGPTPHNNSHSEHKREDVANLEEAVYYPEATRTVAPTSYRSHFRQQYLLNSAWEHGGRLAARYRMRNQNSVIVTTVVVNANYVVMALDTSRILVFAPDGRLLRSLYGHVMGVWALALRGDTLVSGGCDRDVREWNLATGACRQILRGHSSTVRCLAMPRESDTYDYGSLAVSGGRDAAVCVWDLERGKCSHRLVGHTGAVRRLEVAQGRALSASYDCTVRIWDLATGQCLHTLAGHFNQIYSLAVDGNTVATGSLDHTIRVWDLESGECRATLQGHSALVGQLQLRGSTLVSGGSDGAVRVWDLNNYQCVHRIAAHDNSVTCLQFDDERIVTGGPDGRIHVWSTRTGEHVRQMHDRGFVNVWGVAFRDDRLMMVYSENESTVIELISFVPPGGARMPPLPRRASQQSRSPAAVLDH